MKRPSSQAPGLRREALAAPLLSFLASDPARFERFLAPTGFDLASLRAASRSSEFAESLWAYLASDEPLLLLFAAEHELEPSEVSALAVSAAAPPFEE